MLVGIGYDIHRKTKGREIVLGGVEVKCGFKLVGHSDGDVLLHSIADAILGASGLPDIGHFFPTTDKSIKGISSKKILKKVFSMIKRKGYSVINVDSVIIAQKPKISKYISEMKKNISEILHTRRVNIKATTNEGIGLIGKGEAISAFSVVSLRRGGRVA